MALPLMHMYCILPQTRVCAVNEDVYSSGKQSLSNKR